MDPSFIATFTPGPDYLRGMDIKAAEAKISAILEQLEKAHNIQVTEIFPDDGGCTICWEKLDKTP